MLIIVATWETRSFRELVGTFPIYSKGDVRSIGRHRFAGVFSLVVRERLGIAVHAGIVKRALVLPRRCEFSKSQWRVDSGKRTPKFLAEKCEAREAVRGSILPDTRPAIFFFQRFALLRRVSPLLANQELSPFK